MKEILVSMIKVYGKCCWGDIEWKPNKHNILTAHHIKPVREKGKLIWTNVAPLSLYFHQHFNLIEQKDIKIGRNINDVFREINKGMKPPTQEHYDTISLYVDRAEYKYGLVYKRGMK